MSALFACVHSPFRLPLHLHLPLDNVCDVLDNIKEIVNTNTKKPVYVDWRNYNIHDMSLLALEIAYNEYILCKGIGEFNELITCYNLMKNNLPTHQASH